MPEIDYVSKSLDHLGLVSGFCEEIGLVDFIDVKIGKQSSQRNLSYGQCVLAMLLNGLGFVGRTLHMYPQYFESKPLERLLGHGIDSSHINDDVLGRCLDKLYEHGVSNLYQELAEKVVMYLGLPCDSVHLDSSSFHVDGEYKTENDFQGVRLVRGYSRDHRPELNQVIINLITENQAGLPVYMQACSGNTNDSESFKKIVKSHISSLKSAQRSQYFVGDASLYVAETIQSLDLQKQHFITRVPQKLREAKDILDNHNDLHFTEMQSGYSGCWVDSHYAGVQQRWLVLNSEQAEKRERETLGRNILKSTEKSMKAFKKLKKEKQACKQDAISSLEKWVKTQSYIDVVNVAVMAHVKHARRGRPNKEETQEKYYQIQGELVTCLDKVNKAKNTKGFFIIATNDCTNKLEMETILAHYKAQQSVERGFRFLKSPDFLTSSLYLKKPERIEALLMIMTCSLMVYAGLEHYIRTKLKETDTFVADMKGKKTQKPTARWVFHCFQGIHELSANKELIVINIKTEQTVLLKSMGACYQQIYS